MINLTELRKKAERDDLNVVCLEPAVVISMLDYIDSFKKQEQNFADHLSSNADRIAELLTKVEAYENSLKYIRDHEWAEALPKWGHEFVEVAREVLARFDEK